MKAEEFKQQIARLQSVYGEHLYPQERVSQLWERVRDLGEDIFRRGISKIIGDFIRAPMVNQICDELSEELRLARQGKADEFRKTLDNVCTKCNNTGVINMYAKESPNLQSFAFKCDCECGEFFVPSYPKLHSGDYYKYLDYHKRPRMTELKKATTGVPGFKLFSYKNNTETVDEK